MQRVASRVDESLTPRRVAPATVATYTRHVRVLGRYTSLLPLAMIGVAACAGLPAGDPGAASTASTGAVQADTVRSAAVLFVERRPALSHVGARFVQYTGVPSDALPDLLGIPVVPAQNAQGCVARADASLEGSRAEVRLLDVGSLEVRAGDRALHLEPRRFPDLWNVVSGVIYSTDGDLPANTWRFSAAGAQVGRVPAFEVEARSPDELSSVQLAEQSLTEGATAVLPRRGFSVRWARGDRDDAISVVFEQAGAEGTSRVVCTARDEGSLEVDGVWADRVGDMAARGGATITVHRLRARPFVLTGVDQAQVVFDLVLRARLAAGE